MSRRGPRRRQCAKCPWKRSTDPRDIPDGYDLAKHHALARTIAQPGELNHLAMACHESPPGCEQPCVGWLHNQLGVGNNLIVRLRVMRGELGADYVLDGPQHARFEDTLPAGGCDR